MSAPADAVRRRALEAVARTRAVGPHFFGNAVGIDGRGAVDGVARLHLDVEPGAAPGSRVSPTALATLADLTMSAAIRARLGPQNRLGTVTLAVQHLEPEPTGPVHSEAVAARVELDEERGFARCELRDPAGTLVAAVEGWFTAMPMPPGRRLGPVPWELPEGTPVPPVAEADLEPAERAAVDACTAAGERAAAAGTSVVDELLAMTWTEPPDGGVRGELAVGPEHANRGGHVQGGVLYGVAVLAARRAVGDGLHLADGHLQFLRPAHADTLAVQARPLREGRRTAFAEVRLTAAGELVAAGSLTFQRVPGRG
ncbi:acyl-CoA thioesterase domain-containing protein [Geodermatophilus sp. DSM 44513]|uniref:acyl-CoA thioesterase domain-containing protein n=1 Tax=Geodermatophilus sp. DSM 44513 TaxID=1528104 RepID=UPI001276A983|nr:PaaI family thioesterase [Geodermatophilus sp. DSM 44513]WNV74162.1 PaaI family thioesterase [Geodermatophilus sp. DSM 44513]